MATIREVGLEPTSSRFQGEPSATDITLCASSFVLYPEVLVALLRSVHNLIAWPGLEPGVGAYEAPVLPLHYLAVNGRGGTDDPQVAPPLLGLIAASPGPVSYLCPPQGHGRRDSWVSAIAVIGTRTRTSQLERLVFCIKLPPRWWAWVPRHPLTGSYVSDAHWSGVSASQSRRSAIAVTPHRAALESPRARGERSGNSPSPDYLNCRILIIQQKGTGVKSPAAFFSAASYVLGPPCGPCRGPAFVTPVVAYSYVAEGRP